MDMWVQIYTWLKAHSEQVLTVLASLGFGGGGTYGIKKALDKKQNERISANEACINSIGKQVKTNLSAIENLTNQLTDQTRDIKQNSEMIARLIEMQKANKEADIEFKRVSEQQRTDLMNFMKDVKSDLMEALREFRREVKDDIKEIRSL